jgi:hypothetical protein
MNTLTFFFLFATKPTVMKATWNEENRFFYDMSLCPKSGFNLLSIRSSARRRLHEILPRL